MEQHPAITLEWALRSLERAIQQLEDGWAERRVRRQFHQLVVAVERESFREGELAPHSAEEAQPALQR